MSKSQNDSNATPQLLAANETGPLDSRQADRSASTGKSPRRVSARKIEANRCNAKKSTGPKTPRGKRIVSRNAVTHGILAREITSVFNIEDTAEFDDLMRELRGHYEPVGIEEDLWVQEIARIWWRKKLCARSQRGDWEKQQLGLIRDVRRERLKDINIALLSAVVGQPNVRQDKLPTTGIGVGVLGEVLDTARNVVESSPSTGIESEEFERWRQTLFQLFPRSWPKQKEELLAAIHEERKKLQIEQEIAAVTDDWEESATSASICLPSKETLDLLMRYERSIDRQLDTAIARIEQLQRRRKN